MIIGSIEAFRCGGGLFAQNGHTTTGPRNQGQLTEITLHF
jgi:hypothetical protein